MSKSNLYTGKIARKKLMDGVRKASEAVAITLGTAGQNSLIEALESPNFYTTNDGLTILMSIIFSDPLEELGRKILIEAVLKANRTSGDGSSTTTLLTAAILKEGMKHIGKYSPMEIKHSLENLLLFIEQSLEAQKREITVDTVSEVASISAEDQEIGDKIQEIYQKIGPNGIVSWDVSKTTEDSYTIGSGITLHGATYASPYMCDMDENGGTTGMVKWSKPTVLLYKSKITAASDFNGLFQELFNKNIRELIIFCDDFEVPAIVDFVRTRIGRGFKSVVVKMPVLWRDQWWEDLALTSGGQIVDGIVLPLTDVTESHLGHFGNITITKEDAFIDGIQDISKHVLALQVENTDDGLLRASRLNTKTARYLVGGQSESGIAYRRLKVEDAINAAAQALEGGIVPGGGVALLNVATKLAKSADKSVGKFILQEALRKPLEQIVKNAGKEWYIGPQKKENAVYSPKEGFGFNTKTREVVDMFEAKIIDPKSVVMNAVKNAIGVASGILTCGTVVLLPEDDSFTQQLLARLK